MFCVCPQYTPLRPCFNHCCQPTQWPPFLCLTPELHTHTHTQSSIRPHQPHQQLLCSDVHGKYGFSFSKPKSFSLSTASNSALYLYSEKHFIHCQALLWITLIYNTVLNVLYNVEMEMFLCTSKDCDIRHCKFIFVCVVVDTVWPCSSK